jgi:hypothetical protein
MKASSLPYALLLSLAAGTSAFAQYDGSVDGGQAPRETIIVSERAPAMSWFDYFFNNPEKYRTIRRDPGEYFKGTERR